MLHVVLYGLPDIFYRHSSSSELCSAWLTVKARSWNGHVHGDLMIRCSERKLLEDRQAKN